MIIWNEVEEGVAWDCDPEAHMELDVEELDCDGDDWQCIALDRFGDRLVNGRY